MELIQHWPNIWHQTPLRNAKHEIRLLILYNDPDAKMINCYFEHMDLYELKPFYAMSYAWGQAGTAKPIKMGRHEIVIRENVDEMLRTIRRVINKGLIEGQKYPDRRLRLWVDMLCINQNNDEEKSHQVAIMSRIFRDAKMTLAWLGPSTQTLEQTFERIMEANMAEERIQASKLDELKALPYWSRLWVVQEVGLSKVINFVCGERVISYEDMFHFTVDVLEGNHQTVSECFDQFAYFHPPEEYHMVSRFTTAPMHMLTRTFGRHQCSDPRDRIYALHSLCKRLPLSPFTIDYSKSALEVFLDFCYSYAVPQDEIARMWEISLVYKAMGLSEGGDVKLSEDVISRHFEFSCVSVSYVEQVDPIYHWDEDKGVTRDKPEGPKGSQQGCHFLFVCHTPWWIKGREIPASGFAEKPIFIFCEYELMPGDFILVLNEAEDGRCHAIHRNGIAIRTIAGDYQIMHWSEICEQNQKYFCTTPKKGLEWFRRHSPNAEIRIETFLIRDHENRYTNEEHARIKAELEQRDHVSVGMDYEAFLDFVRDDFDDSLYVDSYGIFDEIARELHLITATTQEQRLVKMMEEAAASTEAGSEADENEETGDDENDTTT